MYPKLAKDVSHVRSAITQWMESHDVRTGKDAKIADLWRLSDLLKICPKDVKEQVMMRLDENSKAKVVSYTTSKTERTRGGRQRCMYRWRYTMLAAASQKRKMGNMWTRFDAGHCVTMRDDGALRKILWKERCKGRGNDGGKGCIRVKEKATNSRERKVLANSEDPKKGYSGEQKGWR